MVMFSRLKRVCLLGERASESCKPSVCSKRVCRAWGSTNESCWEHREAELAGYGFCNASSHSGNRTQVYGPFFHRVDNSVFNCVLDMVPKSLHKSARSIAASRSSHSSIPMEWSYRAKSGRESSQSVGEQNFRSISLPLLGTSSFVAGLRCCSSLTLSRMSTQRQFASLEDTVELEGTSGIDPMQDNYTTPTDSKESNIEEGYDFRNFPELQSGTYKDYELPTEMHGRKKRVTVTSIRKVPDGESKLTLDSIPRPKGSPYDFGLQDLPTRPPPLEVGAKPQGGFDFHLPLENSEENSWEVPPSGTLPSTGTSQADNWSEVCEYTEGTV